MEELVIFDDNEFLARMRDTAEPYLMARREDVWFTRRPGEKLHGVLYRADGNEQNPVKGTVVVAHGFTESAEKYREVAYLFLQHGYSCALIDHRGHGHSYREVPQGPLTHVGRFEDYVQDLLYFARFIGAKKQMEKPLFLFSHSMGGCIAAGALEADPGLFQKAILSSPMLSIRLNNLPETPTYVAATLMSLLGQRKRSVTGEVFKPEANFAASCDTCEQRYLYYHELCVQDPYLQNCSPTFRWVQASIRATRDVRRPENCRRIKAPVLLFSAEKDIWVTERGQREFIRRVPKGLFFRMSHTKHEIFMSKRPVLQLYWQRVFAFLEGQENQKYLRARKVRSQKARLVR